MTPTIPTVASVVSRVYYSLGGSGNSVLDALAWRPPQWVRGPALTLTVTDSIPDPDTGQPTTRQTAYVFDGAMRADHEQQAVITLNPIQTGAPITDHAYVVPPRLTVELVMSDAMQSFTVGQWTDGPSRSVSAFKTLKDIQSKRNLCSVATRMDQYDKMLISEVRASETTDTRYAGRFTVVFVQILTAAIEATSSTFNPVTDSERPQTTVETTAGQIQPNPVPVAVQSQNTVQIPYLAAKAGETPNTVYRAASVPGAGSWTSIPGLP